MRLFRTPAILFALAVAIVTATGIWWSLDGGRVARQASVPMESTTTERPPSAADNLRPAESVWHPASESVAEAAAEATAESGERAAIPAADGLSRGLEIGAAPAARNGHTSPAPAAPNGVPAGDFRPSSVAHDRAAPAPEGAETSADDFIKANIGYNLIDRMELGRTYTLRVLVDPSRQADLAAALGGLPGTPQAAVAKILQEVSVDVIAPAFDVALAEQDRIKTVNLTTPTSWTFGITPKTAGTHRVTIKVKSHPQVAGNLTSPLELDSYEKTIEVTVPPKSWFDTVFGFLQSVEGLLSTFVAIVGAAGILWGAVFRRRK